MNRLAIVRFVSVLVGAAVMIELQFGLGMRVYFAIPIGFVAYLAVKVAFGLAWGADKSASPPSP